MIRNFGISRYIGIGLAFLLALAYANLLFAQDDCSEQQVCVKVVETASEINILLSNSSTQDASAEIEWRLENLQHIDRDAGAYLIKAGETKTVTALRPIDPYKPTRFGYSYRWVFGTVGAKHNDSVLYRLPYEVGTQQYVSQSCKGWMSHNRGTGRNAIDFALRKGTKIYAARAGKVIDLYEVSVAGGTSEFHLDDVNFVKIQHDDHTVASYVHLRTMGVKVDLGDTVAAGQFIGYSGDTGFSSGPHLHFEVRQANSLEDVTTVPVKWKAARGVLTCPRAGLALRAI